MKQTLQHKTTRLLNSLLLCLGMHSACANQATFPKEDSFLTQNSTNTAKQKHSSFQAQGKNISSILGKYNLLNQTISTITITGTLKASDSKIHTAQVTGKVEALESSIHILNLTGTLNSQRSRFDKVSTTGTVVAKQSNFKQLAITGTPKLIDSNITNLTAITAKVFLSGKSTAKVITVITDESGSTPPIVELTGNSTVDLVDFKGRTGIVKTSTQARVKNIQNGSQRALDS